MNEYQIRSAYGVKVFEPFAAMIMPQRSFLSLPVKDMPSKGLRRKARKFNRNFKDKIDWLYDGKDGYKFE